MRGQPLDVELKWTRECFSTPPPSYPGPTSTVWGLFTPSWCPRRRRRGGDQCVSSRSSWRPPRAPKAVGALPMLFIALLVAPPISSTGHCSCASQAFCLPPSKQPDFSANIHVAGQNFATVKMLPKSVNLSPSPVRKKIYQASNHIFVYNCPQSHHLDKIFTSMYGRYNIYQFWYTTALFWHVKSTPKDA